MSRDAAHRYSWDCDTRPTPHAFSASPRRPSRIRTGRRARTLCWVAAAFESHKDRLFHATRRRYLELHIYTLRASGPRRDNDNAPDRRPRRKRRREAAPPTCRQTAWSWDRRPCPSGRIRPPAKPSAHWGPRAQSATWPCRPAPRDVRPAFHKRGGSLPDENVLGRCWSEPRNAWTHLLSMGVFPDKRIIPLVYYCKHIYGIPSRQNQVFFQKF